MAVEGGFLQAGSYSAEQLRRATTGILLERGASIGSVVGGLVAATDLQTKAGTGMNVETSPGECVVNQGYSTSGGPNYIRVTSTLTSKVPAASPTLPRVDLLCAQVNDAAYHGSTNEYAVSYLEGTPTSGAKLGEGNRQGAPTLPTSALALAYVLVPANATSILNENIENVAKHLLLSTGSVGTSQLQSESVIGAKVAHKTITGDKLGLTMVAAEGVNVNASDGESIEVTTANATVNLPACKANSCVTIFASNNNCTISGKGTNIWGDFVSNASSIKLALRQHVTLVGNNNGTAWLIVSGESEREEKYGAITERTAETEYEPNASRPTFVVLTIEKETHVAAAVLVNGVTIADTAIGGTNLPQESPVSFLCPAGQKWKVTGTEVNKLWSSYLTL